MLRRPSEAGRGRGGARGRLLFPWRRPRVPVVLQATVTDCGPACLAMVLAAAGRPVGLGTLRDEMGVGRDGLTALDLREEARARGVACRAVRAEPPALRRFRGPMIAHWEGAHFVVVEWVSRRAVSFVDPSVGRRRLSIASFASGYTGTVLAFGRGHRALPSRTARHTPRPAVRPWRSHVLPALASSRTTLGALGVTSAVLLLAGLLVPFVTARAVDQLVSPHGGDAAPGGTWLTVTALGLSVLCLALLRGLAAAHVQERVGRRLPEGLLDRVLTAPLTFSEQRATGGLVSRLMATDLVRDALATRLVAAVLDAVVAVSYLAVLAFTDHMLFVVTATVAAAETAVIAGLAVTASRLRREELVATSRCFSWLVESVRGLAWVKAAGAEETVQGRWHELHGQRLHAFGRAARLGAVSEAVVDAVRIAGPLALLLVAVRSSRSVELPVLGGPDGQAVGLAALASAALLPFGSLAGHFRALFDVRSTVEHLGDLAGAPTEQVDRRPTAGPLRGRVQVHRLGFQHTSRGPWVLREVEAVVPAGGKLAVVGASGSGKSTLVKLLAGLYRPTEGTVLIDDVDIQTLDLPSLRRRLGVVLQEPFLLSGTVRQNIALRRPSATLQEVAQAADLAAVHDDILSLPRGYDTVLAESGSGMSGGQRQRIALARALLDRPAVVVLDEATSHLDVATEARIERNLSELGVTRIVSAHRLSTVQDADHVLVLDGGRVVESGTPADLLAAGGFYAGLTAAHEPAPVL